MTLLGFVVATVLFVLLSVRALRRGFWPRATDSTKRYDRIVNATGGILLLGFWTFLLVADFLGPRG